MAGCNVDRRLQSRGMKQRFLEISVELFKVGAG